jgi:hypothetical protein
MIAFFVQPILLLVVMGALLGNLALMTALGVLVGIGTVAVALGVWLTQKVRLEEQGFRW